MNVLFVALGTSRGPAVVTESAQVLADGGEATVLISDPSTWARYPFADGVEVVELPTLGLRYRPDAVRILLYRIPRLLLRVCLPGPFRRVRSRMDAGYRRRVARPIDRRLSRFYRRDSPVARRRVFERELLRGRSIDLVVVTDPRSLVTVAELADVITGTGTGLSYSIAHERPRAGSARG